MMAISPAVGPITYFASSVLLFFLAYLVILVEHNIGSYFIAFCFACAGVYVAAKLIPHGRVSSQGRAVFITGCDTGFGHGLAHRLDRLGFKVFAGCLAPGKYQYLGTKGEQCQCIDWSPQVK